MAADALTTRFLREHGVLRILANLYPDHVSARALIDSLGGDVTRLPGFGPGTTPVLYWDQLCTLVEHGAFHFTLADLLRAVLRDYPGQRPISDVLGGVPQGGGAGKGRGGGGEAPLRVLCLLAGPAKTSELRLRAEHRAIKDAVRAGERAVAVELCAATRPTDVIPELLRHRPHVLHVGGHGSPNGYLLLETDAGGVAPVHATALAEVLRAVSGVNATVLTACHLGRYADEIAPHTEHVIGATRALADSDALAFCRGFYAALAAGRDTAAAFALGRAEIALAGGDPDGLLHVAGWRSAATTGNTTGKEATE